MSKLPPQVNFNDFADLEKLVESAKDFVQPSEMLRPKVVESARELDLRDKQLGKIRNLFVCTVLAWALVGSAIWALSSNRQKFTAPSSAEVEQRSLYYAAQNRYSLDWGMVDAFWELRGSNSQGTSPAHSTSVHTMTAPDP